MKQKIFYQAYLQFKGHKDSYMIYMNEDFKRRYKDIRTLEEDIKESIKNKQVKNVEKYVIFQYLETKAKEVEL